MTKHNKIEHNKALLRIMAQRLEEGQLVLKKTPDKSLPQVAEGVLEFMGGDSSYDFQSRWRELWELFHPQDTIYEWWEPTNHEFLMAIRNLLDNGKPDWRKVGKESRGQWFIDRSDKDWEQLRREMRVYR